MEMKDLWRIFRDSGIMGAPFSLSCFDRIFYYDDYNKTDIIYIDKNIHEDENIYKQLYDKMNNAKLNFAFKNQVNVLYYYLTDNSEMTKYLYDIIDSYSSSFDPKKNKDVDNLEEIQEEENKTEILANPAGDLMAKNEEEDLLLSEKDLKYLKSDKSNFDVNNSHNPLLLYQFYNALFYASILYFAYNDDNINSLEKFKRIINFINSAKPNFKRGGSKNKTGMSKLESSFMNKANEALNESQRIRNYDYLLIDEFYRDYSSKLIPIFEKLFF